MAANTPSLNKLIELIGLVSRSHLMVRDFRYGPLWDMNALKDLQTPYVWCEELGSRITIGNGSHKTSLFTFKLYCMDRIQKDGSNYNEVLSDTKFILDTIVTELDQHPLFISLGLSLDLDTDVTFEPVFEETDTNSNGHSCEITLRFPLRYTPCNMPFDSLAGYTYSLDNNVYQYSVVGVPGPTGPQGVTGPQGIVGPTGPQGVRGFQGAGGISTAYGIFYDTSIQTNATTYNKMTFDSVSAANLISISDGSEINISIKGTYNIQFSAQVDKTDSGEDDIEIWLAKNGNAESWSNTKITLPKNDAKVVAAWNWMVDANAGDYYEIVWYSADANMRLYAESSPPAQVAIPSVILSVNILSWQGPQGPQGFRGFQGFQGVTGPQGDFGPQGLEGPQGDVGATGSNGQSTSYYNYKANTTSNSGDPGSGYILWDDPSPAATKQLNISHLNSDGIDIDIFLALIKKGDILILQDPTNSNRYQQFTLSDPPVIQSGWVEYNVNNDFSNITFNNDDPITLFILTQGTPGPQGATGAQGASGPQGDFGPQGPQGYQPLFYTSGFNALWYNAGDIVDPAFGSVNYSYSDNDGLYLQKSFFTIVEDILTPLSNKVNITAETLTDDRVWTIPDSTDTFLGKDTYAVVTNKKFTNFIIAPGDVQQRGDIFYNAVTGGNTQRLAIGVTGSILGVTNGIPTWIPPGATNSTLTMVSGLPRFVNKNIVKATDSNAVTGVIVNTLLDSILIPANTIGPGDIVEFKTRVRKTGTAGTMIERFYIGTQSSITGTSLVGLSSTAGATTLTLTMNRTLVVKSATQSETFGVTNTLLNDEGQASTIAVSVTNIDWTRDQFFIVGIQPSAAGDTIRSSFIQIKVID